MSATTSTPVPPVTRPVPPPASAPRPRATLPPCPPATQVPSQPVQAPPIRRLEPVPVQGIRGIINAVEGWGKTTLAAYAPDPLIIQVRTETGYETLHRAALVPTVDCATVQTWDELLAVVAMARDTRHRTIAIDAMGGAERMCHELVCQRDFGGDWSEKGFMSYQRGYEVSVLDWEKLLAGLDAIYRQRQASILLLSHARMRTVNDPAGPSYDRYEGDAHKKTWAATARWADLVLFGTFSTVIVDERKSKGQQFGKGKGIGTGERIIHTTRRDAWDAKNRFGMPELIELHDVAPSDMWNKLWGTITNQPKGDDHAS